MKVFDPTTWPRAGAYKMYRHMGAPHIAITVDVDMTDTIRECRATKTSVFAAVMHRLILAANEVPELRQRIRLDGNREEVVQHDSVDAGFTVGVEGGLFNVASVPTVADGAEYARSVREVSDALRQVTEVRHFDGVRDDLIYMSCLPWVRFTSLTHPVHTDRPDTVPRIAWGKLDDQGDRVLVPVNLQTHHALVDGSHIGAFFQRLQG
jgi:chloramphenicol O-acetyltransferase type A